MNYFDYQSIADEAKPSPDQLETIMAYVRRDYPLDQMLFELHVFRVCRAIRDGLVTFIEAVAQPSIL